MGKVLLESDPLHPKCHTSELTDDEHTACSQATVIFEAMRLKSYLAQTQLILTSFSPMYGMHAVQETQALYLIPTSFFTHEVNVHWYHNLSTRKVSLLQLFAPRIIYLCDIASLLSNFFRE